MTRAEIDVDCCVKLLDEIFGDANHSEPNTHRFLIETRQARVYARFATAMRARCVVSDLRAQSAAQSVENLRGSEGGARVRGRARRSRCSTVERSKVAMVM